MNTRVACACDDAETATTPVMVAAVACCACEDALAHATALLAVAVTRCACDAAETADRPRKAAASVCCDCEEAACVLRALLALPATVCTMLSNSEKYRYSSTPQPKLIATVRKKFAHYEICWLPLLLVAPVLMQQALTGLGKPLLLLVVPVTTQKPLIGLGKLL